jgi:hypothetical protein
MFAAFETVRLIKRLQLLARRSGARDASNGSSENAKPESRELLFRPPRADWRVTSKKVQSESGHDLAHYRVKPVRPNAV